MLRKTCLLLLLLSAVSQAQSTLVCPDKPSTTYIYVNGIWNRAGQPEQSRSLLENSFRLHLASAANPDQPPVTSGVGSCVRFLVSPVDTAGWLQDLLRITGELELNKAVQYANSPDNLTGETGRVKAGVLISWWKYVRLTANELRAYASAKALNYTAAQKNLASLLKTAKDELAAGNKVVLVGHSEGNLYAQAAYDQLVYNEAAWQRQNKLLLPDTSRLVAVGISVPSDHIADRTELPSRIGPETQNNLPGHQRYTTYCQDFIWTFMPKSMGYNATGFWFSCQWSLLANATIEVFGLLDRANFLDKPPAQSTLSMVRSDSSLWSKTLSLAAQFVLTFGTNLAYHRFDSYLTYGSDAYRQIMFDLVALLPVGPDLKNNPGCLLCESFNSAYGDWWKYRWDYTSDVSDFGGTVSQASNGLLSQAQAGSQTLQSRVIHNITGLTSLEN